jgi:hypothetical protein
MRCNKILLLLITSVFTTLSSAAAIEPKVQNIYVRLDNGCPGGFTKRDLEGRAPPSADYINVPIGGFGEVIGSSKGLWTEGLVTCIGVAVTFEGMMGIQYRFLAHLQAGLSVLGSEFNAFETAIQRSGNTFDKMRCVITPPNLNGPDPVRPGFTWTNDDVQYAQQGLSVITNLANALCNGAAKYEPHDMEPPATMQIDPDGTIKINGQ